jgi:aryl-alcohol dehydrogenase-like predicted oxidoreductase
MRETNRREFIAQGLLGIGAVWAGPGQHQALSSTPVEKRPADQVLLGQTGIKLSRLAMGSGTNGVNYSSEQTRLGVKVLSELLSYGFDQGINFWETADQYGSHAHLNGGIKRVGRNRVVIMTKTHARTASEMWADLDRFRKELGTDYIDVILLHCMMSPNWPEDRQGAMETLTKAREKGIIRAHGVSCHTFEALKVASKHPWVQVDLARINPIQAHMDADPPKVISVLREMKTAGKGVIGMKILGAGQLTHDLNRALEYAIKLDCLDTFTIGFSKKEHLDEDILKIAQAALAA